MSKLIFQKMIYKKKPRFMYLIFGLFARLTGLRRFSVVICLIIEERFSRENFLLRILQNNNAVIRRKCSRSKFNDVTS